MFSSVGIDTHGIINPKEVFCFHWHLLVYYGFFFVFGVALYGRFDRVAEQMPWRYYLVLGLSTMILYYVSLDGALASFFPRLVKDFIYSVSTWSIILFLLGFFNRYFNQRSKYWSYLSDSSYWVYLVHLFPAYYLAIFFKDWTVPVLIKFILVLTITTLVSLLSYHYCARYSFIGGFLHQKRMRAKS